jgi:hypothetical protein
MRVRGLRSHYTIIAGDAYYLAQVGEKGGAVHNSKPMLGGSMVIPYKLASCQEEMKPSAADTCSDVLLHHENWSEARGMAGTLQRDPLLSTSFLIRRPSRLGVA